MKTIVLFRHGPPEDATSWMQQGKEESQRPLTEDGKNITWKASEGLKKILNLQNYLICSSPYTRALQTANILKNTLQNSQDIHILECLTPHGRPQDLARLISSYSQDILILVGHQPHLSRLGGHLLFQEEIAPCLPIKRAGALCLTINENEETGQMLWFMTPQQLGLLSQ